MVSRLRVHALTISLDGYAAGPNQSLEHPMGVGVDDLHAWVIGTRAWRASHGMEGGEAGTLDDDFAAAGLDDIGATIMGRNMFGPIRGPWPAEAWNGWWGPNPPFHHPVFVLTHHPRDPLMMEGGMRFHFVTDGIEAALRDATAAANGKDIRLGGGPSTIQQYLRAGLVDDLHVAIAPVIVGGGERLFDHLDGSLLGYRCVQMVSSPAAVHVRLTRR